MDFFVLFFVVLVCSAKALSDHVSPHLRGFPVKNENFTKGSMIWGSIAGEQNDFKIVKSH